MKKIIFALAVLILASCEPGKPTQEKLEDGKCPLMFVTEFTYKGHEYIDFHENNQAGILHNPEYKKCLEAYD